MDRTTGLIVGSFAVNIALLAGVSYYISSDYAIRLKDMQLSNATMTSNMNAMIDATAGETHTNTANFVSLSKTQSGLATGLSSIQATLNSNVNAVSDANNQKMDTLAASYNGINSNIKAINDAFNSGIGTFTKDSLIANKSINVGSMGVIGTDTKGNVLFGNTTGNSLMMGSTDTSFVNSGNTDALVNMNIGGKSGGRLLLGAPVLGLSTLDADTSFASVDDLSLGAGGFGKANERLRISKSGNVGIGTKTPGDKLTVQDGNLMVNNTVDNKGTVSVKGKMGGSLYLNDSTGPRTSVSSIPGEATLGSMTDVIVGAGGFKTDHLHINTNGNVGLGTPNPAQRLHVVGNMLLAPNDDQVSSGATKMTLRTSGVKNKDGNSVTLGIDSTDGKAYLDTGHDGRNIDAPLGIRVSSDEKMTLLPNGNVGVGVKTPQYKMDVNGTVMAKQVGLSANSFFKLNGEGKGADESLQICRQKMINGAPVQVCAPLIDADDLNNMNKSIMTTMNSAQNVNAIAKAVVNNNIDAITGAVITSMRQAGLTIGTGGNTGGSSTSGPSSTGYPSGM